MASFSAPCLCPFDLGPGTQHFNLAANTGQIGCQSRERTDRRFALYALVFQFELNEAFGKVYAVMNQWGMVDVLEGCVAALATSLLYCGISNRRLIGCAIGWLLGTLSFFIKPSGALVVITLGGIATAELLILFHDTPSNRRPLLKFALSVYAIGLCVFGVALRLALSSDYMSREVVARALQASESLRSLNQNQELLGYPKSAQLLSTYLFES